MFDVNNVGGIAERVAGLSAVFRRAITRGDLETARDASGQASPLLAELARLVRTADEQKMVGLPNAGVGLLWERSTDTLESWSVAYSAPYKKYQHPSFKTLTVREALNKIMHANQSDFRLDDDSHELLLGGLRRPFKPPHEQEPWIAIISVNELIEVLMADDAIAQLPRKKS